MVHHIDLVEERHEEVHGYFHEEKKLKLEKTEEIKPLREEPEHVGIYTDNSFNCSKASFILSGSSH